ncbi:MAG: hypothetical protein LBD18_04120 [Treponema sp.]|jgi:hypothetical protein|nr:hypothetical protein [Treponema sp.]
MEMVEKIATALNVEPFRFFVDDISRGKDGVSAMDNYLESLSATERQDLTKRLVALIANDVEQMLIPENSALAP